MSLNVIIVAVIAIVVLVVLIFIFTGKTKFFSQSTSSCEGKGGECLAVQSGEGCPEGYVTLLGGNCDTGKKCCNRFDTGDTSSSSSSSKTTK